MQICRASSDRARHHPARWWSDICATNPEAIYSTQEKTITVDNTYIANKDLPSYTPQVKITNVTEDADTYYVSYAFTTIEVQDSVWRDVVEKQTMNISKSVLGPYGDLGVYVTEQLKQNIDHEVEWEVQIMARKNITQKTVATAYGGLVGKLLDDTTETLPGYTPVVAPPPSTTSRPTRTASPPPPPAP